MADDEGHAERFRKSFEASVASDSRKQMGDHLEGALLAAAINGHEVIDQLDDLPQADDFRHGWNSILWDCVLETRSMGEWSATKFTQLIKERGFTVEQINDVLNGVNKVFLYAGEIKEAATYLKDRSLVMRAQMCAQEFQDVANVEPYWKSRTSLDRLQAQLADIAAGAVHGSTWAFGDQVSSAQAACVPTGLRDFDEMTGGFELGALSLIGARPSIGKSALMCSIMRNMGARGDGCGVFSLEMRSYSLQCRVASAHAYEPREVFGGNSGNPYYDPFLKGTMSDGPNYRRMLRALAEIKKLPIGFDDTKGLSVSDIRARARRLKAHCEQMGSPLRAVFVDHIGHIQADSRWSGNRTQELSEITKRLMEMSGELGIAVVGLSQLSRAVEQRANKRPVLADLRDSGSLEQDAAHVTFLYRDEYYADREREDPDFATAEHGPAERNVMELICAKQRNGPIGTVKLFCEMGANAIVDRQHEYSRRAA